MEPVLHIKSYTCVIYVKELADTVVGAGKHQVFRADRQAENRQELNHVAVLRQNFSFGETPGFALKAFT